MKLEITEEQTKIILLVNKKVNAFKQKLKELEEELNEINESISEILIEFEKQKSIIENYYLEEYDRHKRDYELE